MIWLYIVLGVVLVFGILPFLVLSAVLYTIVLVRPSPKKWGRTCSLPEDPEYVRLYEDAEGWRAANRARCREVELTNERLHLVGEFYDFGADRAVIIIPGRMESLVYSCHYAAPYQAAGYNVLVVDMRAHGLSDGRINSLGYKEYRDILAWGRLLHDELGQKEIFLHGVCIGSSVALFTLVSEKCPDYFTGMTADGMYASFRESFKNHMIDGGHRPFPFLSGVMLYTRLIAGANVTTDGPLWRIGKLRRPILFLHGRQDVFSEPARAELLYEKCAAPKRFVWFEKGGHSRLRVNNPAQYDEAVERFLADLDGGQLG